MERYSQGLSLKLVLCLSIFFQAISCAQKNSNSDERPFNRMVMFLDEGTEGTNTKSIALTQIFGLTLHQQASPAFVSYSVLDNFLTRKSSKKYTKDSYDQKKFELFRFEPSQWNIYHCKDSGYFMFIPKSMDSILHPISVQLDGQTLELPSSIKSDTLDLYNPEKDQTFTDWVTSKGNLIRFDYHLDISTVKNIFLNTSDLDATIKQDPAISNLDIIKKIDNQKDKISFISSLYKPWNMYVVGHGSYGEKTAPYLAGVDAKVFQELLLFFNTMNTHFVAASSCYLGGKNLDYTLLKQDFAQHMIPENITYILAVISSTDSPSYSMLHLNKDETDFDLSRSENIAKFFDLLDQQANPDWLTSAIFQVATYNKIENIPQILVPNVGWFQAFLPASFPITSEEGGMVKPIKNILEQGFSLEKVKSALKQVRQGQPKKTSSPLMIIGNVLLIKHAIEDKPIIVEDKKVILLYPEIVPIPLQFHKFNDRFPIVQSMKGGNAAHVINTITLDSGGVLDFIKDSFFTIKMRRSKKTFLIKSLTGDNDFAKLLGKQKLGKKITLQDVLIHSWADEFSGDFSQDKTNMELYFLLDGQYWKFRFHDILHEITHQPIPWHFEKISERDFNDEHRTLNWSIPRLEIRLKRILYQKSQSPLILRKQQEGFGTVKSSAPEEEKEIGPKKPIDLSRYQDKNAMISGSMLNDWVSNPELILSKDNLLQDLITFSKSFAQLKPDVQKNFINTITSKMGIAQHKKMFSEIASAMENDKDTPLEVAALSIALFDNINASTENSLLVRWKENIAQYYTKYIKSKTIKQLVQEKTSHYFVVELSKHIKNFITDESEILEFIPKAAIICCPCNTLQGDKQ